METVGRETTSNDVVFSTLNNGKVCRNCGELMVKKKKNNTQEEENKTKVSFAFFYASKFVCGCGLWQVYVAA